MLAFGLINAASAHVALTSMSAFREAGKRMASEALELEREREKALEREAEERRNAEEAEERRRNSIPEVTIPAPVIGTAQDPIQEGPVQETEGAPGDTDERGTVGPVAVGMAPAAPVGAGRGSKEQTASSIKSTGDFDIVVQGTLMTHLATRTQPRLRLHSMFAKMCQSLGIILVVIGIFQEGRIGDRSLSAYFRKVRRKERPLVCLGRSSHRHRSGGGPSLHSSCITVRQSQWYCSHKSHEYTGVDVLRSLLADNAGGLEVLLSLLIECVINRLMITICLTDLLIAGMCKMRLFNGYMADDPTLAVFIRLQKLQRKLGAEFRRGKVVAEIEANEAVGSGFKKMASFNRATSSGEVGGKGNKVAPG